VPELANELATFLTFHIVDSDVEGLEANPKKKKFEMVSNSADGYLLL
jgi:hypothetical protein